MCFKKEKLRNATIPFKEYHSFSKLFFFNIKMFLLPFCYPYTLCITELQ